MTADVPAVLVTEAAEADLADIRADTEEMWGEAQWLSYFREMVATFERIAVYPRSGRSRERFAPGLRSVPFREHVIFYLPLEDGGVAIQRILHGAQNAEAILWDDKLEP